MADKFFGTDGIRGTANSFPMTAEIAMKTGMAAGMIFQRGTHRHRVVIGKDTRLSGYMIENALVAGFTAAGMDAFLLGPIPTPAVAMITRSMRADLGVMISASHNRFADNGIKLFGPDGYKLSDEIEARIEELLTKDLNGRLASPQEIGRAKRIDGGVERYVEAAKHTLPRKITLEGLRVVIDCANGAAYKAAPQVLWELGAEVVEIGTQPNGYNINRDCGSTSTDALANKVHEVRADIGIALDGDADRVIIIDERGQVVDGDQLMAVITQSFVQTGRLKNEGLVATIMSNLGLERFVSNLGVKLHRTKVGDRYVVEHMRANGFNVGGEKSGHMVLSDYATTGDGLVAALQLLSVVREQNKPVSQVCHLFEPVPQFLKNVRYSREKEPLSNENVQKAIEDGESRLSGSGRLVIRPSGTEPLIRVMGEGDNAELVTNVIDNIIEALEKAA